MRNAGLYFIIVLLLLAGCEKKNTLETDEYGFKFAFITENYRPFNYQEGSELKGLAPDLLREICTSLQIPFQVSVLPWEEGYRKALEQGNAVLFSTVLNSSRKDLFKWAGPIAAVDWQFYAASPTTMTLNSVEEAKSAGRIGVMRDFATEQYLVQQGFTNLVYCRDNIDAFDKLLKGDIELFPSDRITAEAALQSLGHNIWSVTPLLTFMTDLVYFAFNRQIPDAVLADFQAEIDRLKADGTLERLTQTYLHQLAPPAALQVYTEQYPPITFRNAFGEITGFGTDLVNEIMRRNNALYPVTLTLWSNGYRLIQDNPNFCLFTMDRTAARENLFQWVGPLGSNKTYFFVKAGSGVAIASLEEAKALPAVGTVSSWFSDQVLRQQGFTNLISDPDPAALVIKLMQGEVSAFVCSAVTFPDIVKAAGFRYSQFARTLELMSSDYYIAFSKNTKPQLVGQWQKRLDEMKQDGVYDSIHRKWFTE